MQNENFQSILKKSCRGKTAFYVLFSLARGLTLPVTMFVTQKMIDSISISSSLACKYALWLAVIFLADFLLFYGGKYLELMSRFQEVSWERIRARGFAMQLAGSLLGILYYLYSAGIWIFFLLLAAMLPPLFCPSTQLRENLSAGKHFFHST